MVACEGLLVSPAPVVLEENDAGTPPDGIFELFSGQHLCLWTLGKGAPFEIVRKLLGTNGVDAFSTFRRWA